MSDAINRAIVLSEEYDTMMEVQRNPCGAWMAIQEMAGIIAALPAVQPDAAAIREAALREAASYHELLAADEDALSAKYRGGSNPWFAHVQRASWHREHASAILALKKARHD